MIPQGRIDIHSHLLYGIDDGCQTLGDSLACIERLKRAGYVGTICTPHVWTTQFPGNTPASIVQWTEQFAQELRAAGIDYQIWPGGEVRLDSNAVELFKANGVPTLGPSRCVLFDLWERKWPRWFDSIIDWLQEAGYQPILAHPERTPCSCHYPKKLNELCARGVWLQGNFRAITGDDGYDAQSTVRQLLTERAYTFMALDMHTPFDLENRLEGLEIAAAEFGADVVNELTDRAVRTIIFKE